MPVNNSYALQETLARIRQRYALYFSLPPGVRAGEEREIELQLTDATLRRHPGARRSSLYQACASSQHCRAPNDSPRIFQRSCHARTCVSDRKQSMVFQVKTMLSQKWRAGTPKWMSASTSSSAPRRTLSSIGSLQSPHAVRMTASAFSIAGMPSASQTHIAE